MTVGVKKNWLWFGMGGICVVIAVWQIIVAQSGLKIVSLKTTNPPVTIITPADIPPASRPTVLIAHGFAGSAVLMRNFALTLAHAGYCTVSWDFEGHGANPNPLQTSSESTSLLRDAEAALAEAATTGLVYTSRMAILGHSMGSGVALEYGVSHPDTYATIAISPVPQPVDTTLPHNLLVMAGSLETQFVSNAEQLLAMAGGDGGTLADGTGRRLVIIPNVEHISILFSPTAAHTARTWLDGTFGTQPGAANYVDRRIIWFGLGIMGFIFLSIGGINSLPPMQPVQASVRPFWRRMVGLIAGGIGATLILWLVNQAGVDLSRLLGILMGGYIVIWFGIAGIIALLISQPHLPAIHGVDLLKGLITFLALWLGVGLLGNFVWLPWLLIPERLRLWIPASIIAFPWFLVFGEAARPSKRLAQVGWWLAQVAVIVGSFFLALSLTPGLGFIFIILPVIPLMLGLQSLAISPRQGSWPYALSGAMFTAWLLLAVFPL